MSISLLYLNTKSSHMHTCHHLILLVVSSHFALLNTNKAHLMFMIMKIECIKPRS